MRIDSSPRHPDYWGKSFRQCPAVILDGKWMRNVLMADDEQGLVEVVVVNRAGQPLARSSGAVRRKVLRGLVQIVGAKIGDTVN